MEWGGIGQQSPMTGLNLANGTPPMLNNFPLHPSNASPSYPMFTSQPPSPSRSPLLPGLNAPRPFSTPQLFVNSSGNLALTPSSLVSLSPSRVPLLLSQPPSQQSSPQLSSQAAPYKMPSQMHTFANTALTARAWPAPDNRPAVHSPIQQAKVASPAKTDASSNARKRKNQVESEAVSAPMASTAVKPESAPADASLSLAELAQLTATLSSATTMARSETSAAGGRNKSTTLKPCAQCALNLCPQCLSPQASGKQASSCHIPEHGRSVCASCASSHRIVEIDMNRALTISLAVVPAFLDYLLVVPLNSVSNLAEDRDAVESNPKMPRKLVDSSRMPDVDWFVHFYTHFNGTARLFEIFDACDTSLWAQPLPYAHVFIFASAMHAQRFRSHYSDFLIPLNEVSRISDPNAVIGVSGKLSLRLCSQCNAYQLQHPLAREPIDPDQSVASGVVGSAIAPKSSTSTLIPNFYSSSLCRKNNVSHLKKQRGPAAAAALALTTSGQSEATVSSTRHAAAKAPTAAPQVATTTTAPSRISARILESSEARNQTAQPTKVTSPMTAPQAPAGSALQVLSQVAGIMSSNTTGKDTDTVNSFINSSPTNVLKPNQESVADRVAPALRPQTQMALASALELLTRSSSALPSAGGVIPPAPATFRPKVALRMVVQHQYGAFRKYFRDFPLEFRSDPSNFVRFEIHRHTSYVWEIRDFQYYREGSSLPISFQSGVNNGVSLPNPNNNNNAAASSTTGTAESKSITSDFRSWTSFSISNYQNFSRVLESVKPGSNPTLNDVDRVGTLFSMKNEPSHIEEPSVDSAVSPVDEPKVTEASAADDPIKATSQDTAASNIKLASIGQCCTCCVPVCKCSPCLCHKCGGPIPQAQSAIHSWNSLATFYNSLTRIGEPQVRQRSLSTGTTAQDTVQKSNQSASTEQFAVPQSKPQPPQNSALVSRPNFSVGASKVTGLAALDPWLGTLVSPLSLTDPAAFLVYRFVGFWHEIFKGNAASLSGVHLDALHYKCPGERSFREIVRDGAAFLDELRVLRRIESEDEAHIHSTSMATFLPQSSPLHRLVVHMEVHVLWLLAHFVARVRDCRRRQVVKLLAFHNDILQNSQSVSAEYEAPRTNDATHPIVLDIDPFPLYEQAVMLALAPGGERFNLKALMDLETPDSNSNVIQMPRASPANSSPAYARSTSGSGLPVSLPSNSMFATAISPLVAHSFDEIAGELTIELHKFFLSPHFNLRAYSYFLDEHNVVAESVSEVEPAVVIPPALIPTLTEWSLPAFRPDTIEQLPTSTFASLSVMQVAADFVPQLFPFATSESNQASRAVNSNVSGSIEALKAHRRMRIASVWTSQAGKSLRELPLVVHPNTTMVADESIDTRIPVISIVPNQVVPDALLQQMFENASSVCPSRLQRSLKCIEIMNTAMQLATRVECVFSIASIGLMTAHLFIYWVPNYSLAAKVLRRVAQQCEARLLHNPAALGPSFERMFLLAFRDRSRNTMRQLRAHLAANLTTPFYIGEPITLRLTIRHTKSGSVAASNATMSVVEVEAVFCAVDTTCRAIYVARHPQRGLCWAFAGTDVDLDDLSVWRSVRADSVYDVPMGASVHSHAHHLLIHELRSGRYAFSQFLHDARQRQLVMPQIDMNTLFDPKFDALC